MSDAASRFRTIRRSLVATVSLLAAATPAAAQVQFGGNGHYFQAFYTPNGISWTSAQANAQALGGYLATLTSAAENAFAFNLVNNPQYFFVDGGGNSQGPWLGAQRTSLHGPFAWVTGEAFGPYTNWAVNQPDDCCGGESYLEFLGPNPGNSALNVQPTWNDLGNSSAVRGYVVEFDAAPASVAPEPSTVALMASGLATLGAFVRRRRAPTT